MEWFKAAEKFTDALASSDPTPGGGAAAAMAAAMGCSLALMAIQTTCNKKNTSPEIKSRLSTVLRKLAALKVQLDHFVQEDGEAYAAYVAAKQLPKDNPSREKAMQDALIHAARVPMDTATTAIMCLREIEPLETDISPIILSDIYCAKHLLKTSVHCSIENIKANLTFIQDKAWIEKLSRAIGVFLKSC